MLTSPRPSVAEYSAATITQPVTTANNPGSRPRWLVTRAIRASQELRLVTIEFALIDRLATDYRRVDPESHIGSLVGLRFTARLNEVAIQDLPRPVVTLLHLGRPIIVGPWRIVIEVVARKQRAVDPENLVRCRNL